MVNSDHLDSTVSQMSKTTANKFGAKAIALGTTLEGFSKLTRQVFRCGTFSGYWGHLKAASNLNWKALCIALDFTFRITLCTTKHRTALNKPFTPSVT